MKELYLDAAASMPVYLSVVKSMQASMGREYGNASSHHALGRSARAVMEKARVSLARKINARPWELYFTSGVTEANNWVFLNLGKPTTHKKKILMSAIEHASVREPCEYMRSLGWVIETIPVKETGNVDLKTLSEMMGPATALVSVMHVNNVLGSVQPIVEIARLCKKQAIPFHTDAAQGFGKFPLDVKQGIDFLSASSHKIGGPKGVGFLYAREGIDFKPVLRGGGQERGMRAGTENVPGIVGFAAALEEHSKIYNPHTLKSVRKTFIEMLRSCGAFIVDIPENAPHIIHASFPGYDAQYLVEFLSKEHIYISAGSACESKRAHEDHVLVAIGLDSRMIKGSVRFSFLPTLKKKDIVRTGAVLKRALAIN